MIDVKHIITLDKLIVMTNLRPTLVPIFDVTFLSIYDVRIAHIKGGQAFTYVFLFGGRRGGYWNAQNCLT